MIKHKRGDINHDLNLVFWAKMRKKEYWLSPEDFAIKSIEHKEKCKKWVGENSTRVKTYRAEYLKNNQWKVSLATKKWKENNKEKHEATTKEWRLANRDIINKHSRATKQKYKAKITAQSVLYAAKRRKENAMFALASTYRNRTSAAFRKNNIAKESKTSELLGCSWSDLKSHIERQMAKGMNWENRGGKWHIDHIIPLASAKNTKELARLCHYTNLRPLWAEQNLAKGTKEITHQMALL